LLDKNKIKRYLKKYHKNIFKKCSTKNARALSINVLFSNNLSKNHKHHVNDLLTERESLHIFILWAIDLRNRRHTLAHIRRLPLAHPPKTKTTHDELCAPSITTNCTFCFCLLGWFMTSFSDIFSPFQYRFFSSDKLSLPHFFALFAYFH
jgi:hypothetical protein